MRHSNITEMGVWSYGHTVPIPSCLLQYIPPEIPCFPSPPLTWLAPCSAQYPVGQSQIRAGRKPRFRCSRAFKKAGSTSNQILAQKAIAKLLAQFYFTGWIWPPCACRDLKVERERERERVHITVDLTTKLADCSKGSTRLLICHYGFCIFLEYSSFSPQKRCTVQAHAHLHEITV